MTMVTGLFGKMKWKFQSCFSVIFLNFILDLIMSTIGSVLHFDNSTLTL